MVDAGQDLSDRKSAGAGGPPARASTDLAELVHAIRARRDEAADLGGGRGHGLRRDQLLPRPQRRSSQFREEMLPALAGRAAAAPIRVWSAACATGQEPYSLAMIVEDERRQCRAHGSRSGGSDLSEAGAGTRPERALQPVRGAARPADPAAGAAFREGTDDSWRVSHAVRQRVRWRRINLIAGLRQIGRFDVVFCRYVLCHMTEDAQRKVLEDLTFVVPEDGYLVLGQHETIAAATPAFQPVVGRPGLFRRNPAFAAAAAA